MNVTFEFYVTNVILYNIVITWRYITSCTIWHTTVYLVCSWEPKVQYHRRLMATHSKCLGNPNLVCDPDVTNHCTKGFQLYLSQPSTHICLLTGAQCTACVDRRHQPRTQQLCGPAATCLGANFWCYFNLTCFLWHGCLVSLALPCHPSTTR